MTKQYITTSVGEIQNMYIAKPSFDKYKNRDEYYVRLKFDADTAEGLAVKKAIADINTSKIVTSLTESQKKQGLELKGNEFIVKFVSLYQPIVLDQDDKELKGFDIKFFNKSDSGKAIVKCEIDTRGTNGTVYLKKIKLLDMQYEIKEDLIDLEGEISKEHKNITI